MCFSSRKDMRMTGFMGDWNPSQEQQPTQSSAYTAEDIEQYKATTESQLKDYTTLSAEQKVAAVNPEFVGIKGAIPVPVSSSYSDSKSSLNEIVAQQGELAAAAAAGNIELCGFLSNLPSIDIDMAAPQLGIPGLQDIMKEINGIATPALEFGSDAIVGIVGGASKAIGDLASALQSNVPTVTCGGVSLPLPTPTPLGLATALIPGGPLIGVVAPILLDKVGITPPINISSPDVTVQSLNDVLEAGEF
jgi:hypothetical protein